MSKVLAEWHAQPSLEQARALRQQLATVLEQQQIPGKDDFLLAVAELVVNLCRYPEPMPQQICLRLLEDPHYWSLELQDDGGSFRNFSQHLNNRDPLEAAESGMGLRLLAAQFDDIAYVPACYRDDANNLMVLRRRREPQSDQIPTVLLVDDDPTYRAIVAAYLGDRFRLIEAESVRQAYSLLLSDKPELVICDISMPEQDGTALFEQLSHIPQVAATAFVYLSGCDDPQLIARALSRPIDDYLTKPVSRDKLLQTVDRVLQRKHHLQERLQRELDQKVTLGLHPDLPEQINGYQCALRCQIPQAGGGDLVMLHHHRILFADLMGHGVEAKGYAFALAGYLRGLCSVLSGHEAELAGLLSQLSKGFDDDPVLSETLATVMAADLGEAGQITLANAGHPKPLLIEQGKVTQLDVAGPMPGMGVDAYSECRITLPEGARLLLYSDGFWDAAEALPETLLEALSDSADLSLQSAADHLMMCRNRLSSAEDDCTLILLQR